MLELFIQNGCSSNLPTSHGRLIHTVLTSIKTHRNLIHNGTALKVLRLLASTDCDINVKDHNGKSPLLLAAELADPGIMGEILKHCLDWQLSCSSRVNGHTPLHMACMNGSVECVCLLLRKLNVEDINVSDTHDFTPLQCSMMMLKNNMMFHNSDGTMDNKLLQVQYGHIAIIELLLAAGATPLKNPAHSAGSWVPWRHVSTPYNTIRTALDIVHEHELKSKLQFCEPYSEILRENCSLHLQHFVNIRDTDRKFVSPYAEVVRVLFDTCSVIPCLIEDHHALKSVYPCIYGLLTEIDEYVQASSSKGHTPQSLLSLSRKTIRLRVAECNKLFLLDQLPLPRKLVDYVRFAHF